MALRRALRIVSTWQEGNSSTCVIPIFFSHIKRVLLSELPRPVLSLFQGLAEVFLKSAGMAPAAVALLAFYSKYIYLSSQQLGTRIVRKLYRDYMSSLENKMRYKAKQRRILT